MVLMNYLQGRDRDTDIENEHVDMGWGGGRERGRAIYSRISNVQRQSWRAAFR